MRTLGLAAGPPGVRVAVSYQLINKNFKAIERFRSVEFNRDYNLSSSKLANHEQIVGFKWSKLNLNKKVTGIDISYINRQKEYFGFKSALDINSKVLKNGEFLVIYKRE